MDDSPVGIAQTVDLEEDSAGTSITLDATDPDGQTSFTYAVTTNPGQGNLVCNSFGSCTYTPDQNVNGQDLFRFTATDATSLVSTNTTVWLNIAAVDDVPVATPQSVTVTEDISKSFYLTASEIDGELLTFTVIAQPATGTVTCGVTVGYCTYRTDLNSELNDSFTYTLSDGTTTTTETLVSINVTAVNDYPVFTSPVDLGSINEGASLNFTSEAIDPEGAAVTYSLFNYPTWMSIDAVTGVVSGTPGVKDSGTHSFQIRANDGSGTGSQIATLQVIDPAAPGVVTALSTKVSESRAKISWVTPADTDITSTTILRKSDGSCPASVDDGTIVQTITNMNNALSAYSFTDDNESLGLLRDTTYCYGVYVSDEVSPALTIVTAEAIPAVGVARYALNGSDWNDYIIKDGANYTDATDAACVKTAAGLYSSCIHGGEARQFEVPGYSSCANLTATDTLAAFNWVCDASSNPVRMVSTGLQAGKGLSDLIDFTAPAWLNNSITVSESGTPVYNTPASAWWKNPINTVTASASLAEEGSIYVVNTDLSADLTVDAPRIAVVIKPGVALSGASGTTATQVIKSSTVGDFAFYWREFLWFEGTINATSEIGGLSLRGITNSVLKNVSVYGANETTGSKGVSISYATRLLVDGLRVSNHTGAGLYLGYSSYNLLRNIASYNNGTGINLTYSTYNLLSTVSTFNNGSDGLYQGFGGANGFFNMITANNNGSGVIHYETPSNKFTNLVAVNNKTGIAILNNSTRHVFTNVVTADNTGATGGYGLMITSDPQHVFQGLRKSGGNTQFCVNQALGGSTNCPAFVATSVSTAATFVAEATADTVNADDAVGVALYDNITNWLGFDNDYRGWGVQGSLAYPDTSNLGACGTGVNCQIWDWSLALGDTGDATAAVALAVNAIPGGDDISNFGWSSQNASYESTCSVFEATWDSQWNNCFTQALSNAIEIASDGIGNDNGLCESNETCLYTPNIGAYQGHGELISAGSFTDSEIGGITGVTLLKHTNNGY